MTSYITKILLLNNLFNGSESTDE